MSEWSHTAAIGIYIVCHKQGVSQTRTIRGSMAPKRPQFLSGSPHVSRRMQGYQRWADPSPITASTRSPDWRCVQRTVSKGSHWPLDRDCSRVNASGRGADAGLRFRACVLPHRFVRTDVALYQCLLPASRLSSLQAVSWGRTSLLYHSASERTHSP